MENIGSLLFCLLLIDGIFFVLVIKKKRINVSTF